MDEGAHIPSNKLRTPLPVGQLTILLFLRFCEAASMTAIFPFIKELIASVTGGNEEKVGYYAGIMESTGQLVSLITVMFWSRLSDQIGRKPILLLGTFALAVSMTSFGLTRVFWGLVLSRCIFRGLNSNAGVIKGIIGEITDNTNSADAFALLHVPWAVGYSFGALAGGWLARPHDHYPSLFSGDFWIVHPYFLPCFAMACLSLVGCVLMQSYLQETVKEGYLYKNRPHTYSEEESLQPLLQTNEADEEPVPIQSLLIPQILTPVMAYTVLSGLHAASNTIQPLFFAMSVELGGLSLPPRTVGYILGLYGLLNSLFQTFVLPRVVRKFGAKKVFSLAMMAFIPIFAFPPLMNGYARNWGFGPVLWILLSSQLTCSFVMELAYGCSYMFITASAPNRRSLGAVNGLAQTTVSIGRIVVPALASSLLSFSIQHRLLGGHAVYVALAILSLGGVMVAGLLPATLERN